MIGSGTAGNDRQSLNGQDRRMMNKTPWLVVMVTTVLLFALADNALAQRGPGPFGGPPWSYKGMPYGHFCPGHGRGPYGKRMPVATAEEAKQVVETYFSAMGEGASTGKIEENRLFFEVEILNKDGVLIDRAIVDRRTGRIRSIY
jgi:hypothetical protein